MRRPETILKPRYGGAANLEPGCEACRIDRLDGRREDGVAAGRGEKRDVGLERARIGGKILVRRELRRIDEDRHHDAVGLLPGQRHQRDMAGVQRAHGRRQRDRLAPRAPARHRRAQSGDVAQNENAALPAVGHVRALSIRIGDELRTGLHDMGDAL